MRCFNADGSLLWEMLSLFNSSDGWSIVKIKILGCLSNSVETFQALVWCRSLLLTIETEICKRGKDTVLEFPLYLKMLFLNTSLHWQKQLTHMPWIWILQVEPTNYSRSKKASKHLYNLLLHKMYENWKKQYFLNVTKQFLSVKLKRTCAFLNF